MPYTCMEHGWTHFQSTNCPQCDREKQGLKLSVPNIPPGAYSIAGAYGIEKQLDRIEAMIKELLKQCGPNVPLEEKIQESVGGEVKSTSAGQAPHCCSPNTSGQYCWCGRKLQ